MKVKLKTNSYICKLLKVNGITLYPFVLIKEARPSSRLLTHEAIHVEQVRRVGPIKFYSGYLIEYLMSRLRGLSHHQAYLNISYEKEAYGHEHSWEGYRELYGASRSMVQEPSDLFS